MTGPSNEPTPPEGLPRQVVENLKGLDAEELRKAIIHAQELLQFRAETAPPIEPGPGEDIIRITEHEGYTEVVKQFSCADGCSDCPHGPYLYHVTEESQMEGGKEPHWKFLGRVFIDDEDDEETR